MTNMDRARSLFDAAMALPEADRKAYLAKQCVDEPELEELVLRLLSQATKATVGSPLTPIHSISLPAGTKVGGYTIINAIGEGGMGVVYRALQQHPEREVALKLIQPGAMSGRMLRRFELETEVLGRLKHPGIAQIYEAGTQKGPNGAQPYFAMELVDGLPLNDYVSKKEMDIRGRLELMAKVCDAVEHAHQKGVIHRDLKPANILITADGQPKILDFGVARATESDLQSVTLQTDMGQLVGTIPYMSPEQVLGDPAQLDTRSDVYGLGVVLYELLSGQLPYQLPDRMIHEAVRVIREVDPTRLSSLSTKLGGDVEIITGKALEKEKERRYQSASGLASDIRHYLENEPIVARPASRSYQIRKFARRNRTLVGGVAATVMVLVLGVVATTYQWRGAVVAREAELQQKLAAEASVNFLLNDMLGSIDPAVSGDGASVPIHDVIDNAVSQIQERFGSQPLVELRFRLAFGSAYILLGRHAQALEQLKIAELLHRKLGFEAEDDTGRDIVLRIAESNWRVGNADEAIAQYQKLEQLVTPETDQHFKFELANGIGSAFKAKNELKTARLEYQRAFAIAGIGIGHRKEQLLARYNLTLVNILEAVQTRTKLGKEQYDKTIEEALASMNSIYEESLVVYGQDSPFTLNTQNEVASQLLRLGDFDASSKIYQSLLPQMDSVFGSRHWRVIEAKANFAYLLRAVGDYEGAQRTMEYVFAGYKDVYGSGAESTVRVANRLADLNDTLGNTQLAHRLLKDSLDSLLATGRPADDIVIVNQKKLVNPD